MTRSSLPKPRASILCWTLRVTGLLLTLGSLFFFLKDIGLGATDNWFFALTMVLGTLTFAAGFSARAPRPSLETSPSMHA